MTVNPSFQPGVTNNGAVLSDATYLVDGLEYTAGIQATGMTHRQRAILFHDRQVS